MMLGAHTWFGRHRTDIGVSSPETILLLAVARVHMGAADEQSAASAIQRGIAWDTFLPLATQHGLLPLFHRHVFAGAVDATAIPGETLGKLQHAAEVAARRSLYLAGELGRLLRDFSAQEIPVVPLKGPVLAQELYGSIALRNSNDLDLLFSEADIPRAVALLQTQGYQLYGEFSDSVAALAHSTSHHVSLLAPSRSYRVELHYHVVAPLRGASYGIDAFSGDLRDFSFLGVPTRVLSPEALLVYLCLHGSGHVWERLEWVCGVAELLRSGQVQRWDRVSACARRFRAHRRVHAGVHLAHALLNAPIPDTLDGETRWTRAATRSVVTRLMHNPRYQREPVGEFLYQFRTDAGVIARWHRCWTVLFTPHAADTLALQLPRGMWSLYGLLRPLRLLYRHRLRLRRV